MTKESRGSGLNSEIERLKRSLQQMEMERNILQRNCKHKWLEPIYDPETVIEYSFSHYEGKGSDPIAKYDEIPREKPRWSRECECCGKKEYTYERKAIAYEPDFR